MFQNCTLRNVPPSADTENCISLPEPKRVAVSIMLILFAERPVKLFTRRSSWLRGAAAANPKSAMGKLRATPHARADLPLVRKAQPYTLKSYSFQRLLLTGFQGPGKTVCFGSLVHRFASRQASILRNRLSPAFFGMKNMPVRRFTSGSLSHAHRWLCSFR